MEVAKSFPRVKVTNVEFKGNIYLSFIYNK